MKDKNKTWEAIYGFSKSFNLVLTNGAASLALHPNESN
jgi:hypothetical protein